MRPRQANTALRLLGESDLSPNVSRRVIRGPERNHNSLGRMCKVSSSKAAMSQSTSAVRTADFRRVISCPLTPARPPFNWMSRTWRSSALSLPFAIRNATASMMPVRGAPVLPSKKATCQPRSAQYAFSAALLAASALCASIHALLMRRVFHDFSAAVLPLLTMPVKQITNAHLSHYPAAAARQRGAIN